MRGKSLTYRRGSSRFAKKTRIYIPFSMAIGNRERMHDCFSKQFRMEIVWWNKTIKQRKNVRREEWIYLNKYSRHARKKKSRRRNYSSSQPSSVGRYYPKQWMHYLTTLTITYNPSITPGGYAWSKINV